MSDQPYLERIMSFTRGEENPEEIRGVLLQLIWDYKDLVRENQRLRILIADTHVLNDHNPYEYRWMCSCGEFLGRKQRGLAEYAPALTQEEAQIRLNEHVIRLCEGLHK